MSVGTGIPSSSSSPTRTIYKELRAEEPVCYVDAVGLWLVTRWDDVQHVDKSPELFTGETEPSTLNRTFGKNLLGSEGRTTSGSARSSTPGSGWARSAATPTP